MTVLFALAISLLVHGFLLAFVPVSGRDVANAQAEQTVAVLLEPPEKLPPPPEEVTLGLDAKLPPSMTWLGFTDFLKHAGPLAEVEQAEFSPDPAGAESRQPPQDAQAPMEAEPPPVPEPPVQEESPTEQTEESVEEAPQELPALPNTGENTPTAGVPEEAPKQAPAQVKDFAELPDGELPSPIEGPTPAETVQWIQSLQQAIEHAMRESKAEPVEHPEDAETPRKADASESAAQPQPQPQPAVPPQPPPGPAGQGDMADKESDPSSIIEVPKEQWERGRPIATQGLELKPRKPHFTILTMITSAPCNPLCEITFGGDGVPTRARLLTGSCDSRVDEGILNSLYGWRATGDSLKALQNGQTVTIQIKLILSRRG
jgi:hypothetical protein